MPTPELPGRIFIVRHGERLDSKDKRWWEKLHSDRPHDSPLTDHGRFQGRVFGAHVLDRCGGDRRGDAHFSVVTSPMVRAVDTAHHIAEPLGLSRLHVDEALIEQGWYMEDGLRINAANVAAYRERSVVPSCRAVVLGDAGPRTQRVAAGEGQSPTVSSSGIIVPMCGVSLDRDALKTHVSPLVNTKCNGMGPTEFPMVQDPVTGRLTRVNGAEGCCDRDAIRAVSRLVDPAQRAELPEHWRSGEDHTVILVGHGDSIYGWCKALTGQHDLDFPSPFEFNCFVELRRTRPGDPDKPYELASPYFGTEHLKGERLQQLMVKLQPLGLPPIATAAGERANADACEEG
uniref:Uncharacterized protein n=1 Tax=Neobodo designis TaxID=312471 RepID=A0A7S1W242_NEODS